MFERFDEKLSKLSGSEMAGQVVATLPSSVTDVEKKDVSAKVEQLLEQQLCDLKVAGVELENEVNQKVEKLAQTTKDLEKIPFLGSIGLFLRGMQRPIWGFALLYIDLKVLSGSWKLPSGSETESAFWLLNLLILGFLFGERAVSNVMPMINRRLGKSGP
ncbi:MAG: hypothetical protein BBJ57_05790 [Desulfobacterales bacterium PC51MH44]|nr:MAG: hypothetical protein BBJ57_05790 [Desulfobacterales bacterium PC51MH44]